MNYDALIEALQLKKYSKLISESKITSVKLSKKNKTINVFLCVDQTWPYAVYKDFKEAFESFTGYECKLQFMVNNVHCTAGDVTSFVQNYIEKHPKCNIFTKTLPIIEDEKIICKFNSEYINAAYGCQNEISKFLCEVGITYPLVVKENAISITNDDVTISVERPIERRSNNQTNSFGYMQMKKPESYTYRKLVDVKGEEQAIQIRGKVFSIEESENKKRGTIIMSYYVTDYTDSIIVKCFEGKTFDKEMLKSIKINDEVIINGSTKDDPFARELVLMADEIIKKTLFEKREDTAEEKRIELHAHTKMSEMDAVCDTAELIKLAHKYGHRGIAITDHMNVQGYPAAQNAWKAISKENPDFKVIYGIEMNMVDPVLDIVVNPDERLIKDAEYCVFDLETTGLSARYDEIIEFGAVIMKEGQVIDRIDFFIEPDQEIPTFIQEKTNITNKDVKGAIKIADALPRILKIMEGRVLVAHNAKFDVGFMNAKLAENGYPELTNPVIDTLDLARAMLEKRRSYRLGHICSHYKIDYDEEVAHRADYDADVLSQVFYLMMIELRKNNVDTLIDMQNYQDENSFKKVMKKHVTLLVKNKQGLKDLFKLVSLSNVTYLLTSGNGEESSAEPRIPREKINELRANLLVGSSCQNGEIFEMALNKTKKELQEAMKFYDYIEIQPLECYSNLVVGHSVRDKERLQEVVVNLIEAAKEMGKLIVATGDVHYINPEDKMFRDVYVSAKGIGGTRHPLYFYNKELRWNNPNPDQHFRTTNEMLECFSFLPEAEAKEYVIDNPNKIFDQIEVVKPMHDDLYPPNIDGDKEKLREICYENAYKQYGNPLPAIVEERLERELKSIIGNGYAVIYYVAHLLVKKSNDDGYIVGSRGSVGSSFVATMSNITEVNPLAPHYYCPHCQHSEWFTDGSVASGYDLPNKDCPKCGHPMKGDGQDIPFETFLGFKGDKVPDIDLNFSGEYQEHAHAYTKVIFGEDNVLRAGTIAGVAEKTAYGYVKGYFEDMGILEPKRNAELTRLAKGCQDVKRTTGQHPGGIIVIPQYMDVHDFTPLQCPANNLDSAWKTSHFDFHAIHDNVLKLDILGHVDPTALKMCDDLMKQDPEFDDNFTLKDIPMNDPDVISLFYSTDSLCLDNTNYPEKTGAAGLPEFGTQFVRGMLEQTQPHSFAELVQISGLSHGTDVWLNNAQELIANGTCVLKEVIGCRDDIMVYLMHKGLEPIMAFTIMESVRKGKGLKPEMKEAMEANNVPQYYIDSCLKIKYMFPKAHAVAYVLSALRIAWFKVHHPHYYYSVFFTTRCDAYDIEIMSGGLETVRNKMNDIKYRLNNNELKKTVTQKEIALYSTLEVVLEMYLRGYSMSTIDMNLSLATKFRWHPDNKHIIVPPFSAIDGLGASVAETIVAAREEHEFISQEDIVNRTRLSGTLLKKIEDLGALKGLQKENQLSLF